MHSRFPFSSQSFPNTRAKMYFRDGVAIGHMMAIIQALDDKGRHCGILKWWNIAKYPTQSGILGAPWYLTFSDHPRHLGERLSSRKRRDTAHRRRPKTTAVLRYGLIQAIAKFQFKYEKGNKVLRMLSIPPPPTLKKSCCSLVDRGPRSAANSCRRRLKLGSPPCQAGGLRGRVLLVVVVDGRLDGILGKHAAVELDRWEALCGGLVIVM
jgi:hypothetical protein